MASPNIPQREPESGAADQGPYTPTAGSSESYADTDRFGSTQKGETINIMLPQNRWNDSVWGVNGPSGGINSPETPDIPATTGE
jgi:hypothetical protein